VILGVGIDLAETPRIARLCERWGERFTHRVFTAGERVYAADRARAAEHLAARFAAKEAVLKALGVPSGLSWQEMEVVSRPRTPPALRLSGRAEAAARALGVVRIHLSLSHAAELACAVVILEGSS
jgi:holo-[acyl-carrier protein] synthase